jgi:hypothetical protein
MENLRYLNKQTNLVERQNFSNWLKEQITVKFGPDKHPQSTEIKKKTKETKLKKTMQSWKEEQEKEQQIGVKIGWGGG